MSYYYLVVGLIYKLELINQKQYEELNKLAIKGVIPDQPEAVLSLIEKVLKEDEESFAKRIRTLESRVKTVENGVDHSFLEIFDKLHDKFSELNKQSSVKKKTVSKNIVDKKK